MMKYSSLWLKLYGCLLASSLLLVGCATRPAESVWQVHLAFGSSVPGPGTTSVEVIEAINKRTGGAPTLRRFEPGQLASGYRYADAVGSRSIEAAFGTPVAHTAKNSAFQFFSTIPFAEFETFYNWLQRGDGQNLMDELYARYGMKGLACGAGGREGAGWFRQELQGPGDLAGRKFMAFGFASKVLADLGATPVLLPGSEVIPAIQSGEIDAIEFNLPTVDEAFGIPNHLKNHYYPGWHQPFSIYELTVNLDLWQSLAPATRRQIEEVCEEKVLSTFAASEEASAGALNRFRDQGVAVNALPASIWTAAESAWERVLASEFQDEPDAKRIHDSYQSFAASF